MRTWKPAAIAMAVAALVAACGGGDGASDGASFDLTGAPGSLLATPTALVTLPPAAFSSVDAITGGAKCTVTFNYFQYGTVGGAGEKTTASGGIMVPSGDNPACQGKRPVLLYAHGTSTDKNKNMASPQDREAALVAAIYAAQGYIVVAPNYAGYEASTLPYHPYLNLDQQAQDVVDALTAARKGFAAVGANAGPALFVTGYSQGGFVSMAAQRKLQLDGTPAVAGAHLSGPYALGLFGDLVYGGNVNVGATLFTPLLNTSFQRAYGNLYSNPGEMYEDNYAPGIESLLPSTTPDALLGTTLPTTAMFAPFFEGESTKFGFGTPNLIKTSYRSAVLADAAKNPYMDPTKKPEHPLRQAAYENDLLRKKWTPQQPMLLCGGGSDPTVFYTPNTAAAAAQFKALPGAAPVIEVNVDTSPTVGDGFDGARQIFSVLKTQEINKALTANPPANPTQAVAVAYHGTLVAQSCNAAAKGYFDQVIAAAAAAPR
jgi:hypothetical protein